MVYKEIEGDLIELTRQGKFDVIAHGCNCFCRMKRGIAVQMAQAFSCDTFPLEHDHKFGDINKLGQIDYRKFYGTWVVNCYTQYQWETNQKPFDYVAFTLCMRKLNRIFKGGHIGLPQIGSHLAGGDWETIKQIIQLELKDMEVTVVIYKPKQENESTIIN